MGAEASPGTGRAQPFPYWLVSFDGTQLRKRRLANGLSQNRLAYHSGVSLETIQRIEQLPAASCRATTLRHLAAALSADPDGLIRELTRGVTVPPGAGEPGRRPQRLRRDQWWHVARPFPADRTEHGRYDLAMARELLGMTTEFPDTKDGMLILLTEYRHALYDIAGLASGELDDFGR